MILMLRRTSIAIPLLAVGLLCIAAAPPAQETLVLRGALIRTQTASGDFTGTIVIREGKIVAVGPDAEVPPGAKILDVSRCVITPGLIDAHGTLGLNAAAAAEGGREATLNILDAVDPFSEDWREAARQGVTAVYAQPSSSGSLGGSGAVLRIGPAVTAEGRCLRSPAGIQAALGAAPPAPAQTAPAIPDFLTRRGGAPVTPAAPAAPAPTTNSLTRHAQFEQLRAQFEAAKRYGEAKPARPEAPKELLLRALKGEIPVLLEIHHEDDLRNALRLTSDYGLRVVFEHLERARPLPEELSATQVGLILGPFSGARPPAELRKLALDGRRFAIGTFGSESRATVGLRLHAAAAVTAGFPREKVLSALTKDAAELLGVGDRLGSISHGRVADLVVFAGDPLDPSAPVRLTISQGQVTFDDPRAEPAPLPALLTVDLPEKLPAEYTIRTTRLLSPAGEFAPGEVRVVQGRVNGPSGSPLPVIDVGDAPVTPGLVAAQVIVPGETAPDADSGHLRATDGLVLDEGVVKACRDGGFLAAVVAPGSGNVIAGVSALARSGEAADSQVKFVLTAAARSRERFPVSLAGQIKLIDDRLRGAPSSTQIYLPPSIEKSMLGERDRVLYAVRNQQLTAAFEAQTRTELRAALRLAAEHRLRCVLVSPRELDGLAAEIRQANAAVVMGPVKPQDPERTFAEMRELVQAGVPLALGGTIAEMRTSAAALANAGLARQQVRRALLAQPPQAFGLPEDIGKLSAGTSADLVVWSGDPLDTTSRPVAVILSGQRVAIGGAEDLPAGAGRSAAQTPARPRGRGR
jgi:imidazolonepropionase-like amidohydrolase